MSIFKKDVLQGLSQPLKRLSSKYFYDDQGSKIFRQIMEMPSYYLTDCETEIIRQQSASIHRTLSFEGHFNIIELGAGDGAKTLQFLTYLTENSIDFTYIPVDISQRAIELLENNLRDQLPSIKISPVIGDYYKVLQEKVADNIDPNLLLFLGSNIGNYFEDEALELLQLFSGKMRPGDKLLIGIDLKKNPITIHEAYYDPQGITKRFNLNLLQRINRELGANFVIADWDFYCHYNPINGEVKSYLVSLEEQSVYIEALEKRFHFEKNELIWTELSKKFSIGEIEELATKSGFRTVRHFIDHRHFFTDSLWEK